MGERKLAARDDFVLLELVPDRECLREALACFVETLQACQCQAAVERVEVDGRLVFVGARGDQCLVRGVECRLIFADVGEPTRIRAERRRIIEAVAVLRGGFDGAREIFARQVVVAEVEADQGEVAQGTRQVHADALADRQSAHFHVESGRVVAAIARDQAQERQRAGLVALIAERGRRIQRALRVFRRTVEMAVAAVDDAEEIFRIGARTGQLRAFGQLGQLVGDAFRARVIADRGLFAAQFEDVCRRTGFALCECELLRAQPVRFRQVIIAKRMFDAAELAFPGNFRALAEQGGNGGGQRMQAVFDGDSQLQCVGRRLRARIGFGKGRAGGARANQCGGKSEAVSMPPACIRPAGMFHVASSCDSPANRQRPQV